MAILGIYFYRVVSRFLLAGYDADLAMVVAAANDRMELQIRAVGNIQNLLFSSEVLRTEANRRIDPTDEYDAYLQRTAVEKELKRSAFTYLGTLFEGPWDDRLITSVWVFLEDGRSFRQFREVPRDEVESDAQHRRIFDRFGNLDPVPFQIPPGPGDPLIHFLRPLVDTESTRRMGIAVVDVDPAVLGSAYAGLLSSQQASWFLLDLEGRVLASSDPSLLGTVAGPTLSVDLFKTGNRGEEGGGGYSVWSRFFSSAGLTGVVRVPTRVLYRHFRRSLLSYLFIVLLVLAGSLGMGLLFSLRLSRPLIDAGNRLRAFGAGDHAVRMPGYRERELDDFATVFNRMASEIDHLVNVVFQSRVAAAEMELRVLQNQINPHFMFNVLMGIAYEARMAGNTKVYTMTRAFSRLLQSSIYPDRAETVPLREELKILHFYLYLQRKRFGKKVRWIIRLEDPGLLDLKVLRLVLQPLVENAVVHGLEKKTGRGCLFIGIRRVEGRLSVVLEDDGVGFDPENPPAPEADHHRVGLANTRKRLGLFYRGEAGFELTSAPGRGTRIEVLFPLAEEGSRACTGF